MENPFPAKIYGTEFQTMETTSGQGNTKQAKPLLKTQEPQTESLPIPVCACNFGHAEKWGVTRLFQAETVAKGVTHRGLQLDEVRSWNGCIRSILVQLDGVGFWYWPRT